MSNMKLTKSKNYDINYLAKVVNLETFEKHPDPEVTRLKLATIGGYKVVIGIDSKPGMYIYFPALSQINPDFLRFANLYRHSEKNADDTKKGLFEDNGKVTAIKLRGQVSEGFLVECEIVNNWIVDSVNKSVDFEAGAEFDTIEHDGKSFWINKKYVKQGQRFPSHSKGVGKQPKGLDKLIPNQFRFHYDTTLIKKCPHVLHPDDLISITEKIHGTSGISAYVFCHKELTWKEKIAKWLTGNEFNQYDYIYSSRSVVKNKYYNQKVSDGFYGVDVWAEADKFVRPYLQKGMTMYYEIVGYLPTGAPIQKLNAAYDYGCVPPTEGEKYTPEKHFKVRIYRITLTNVDGLVHEFSAREVQQYCANVGLIPVTEFYYGYAGNLYPGLDTANHWNEEFLNTLANDGGFYMEQLSPSCNNKVPHEGVVIKIENSKSEAFKLKCFSFIRGELANEDFDIESAN